MNRPDRGNDMRSDLEVAIREHLDRFLAGELSLQEFDAWFVPATWRVEQMNDPGAEELTWEIFLRLAEHSNGHRSLAETKDLLRSFAAASAEARATG